MCCRCCVAVFVSLRFCGSPLLGSSSVFPLPFPPELLLVSLSSIRPELVLCRSAPAGRPAYVSRPVAPLVLAGSIRRALWASVACSSLVCCSPARGASRWGPLQLADGCVACWIFVPHLASGVPPCSLWCPSSLLDPPCPSCCAAVFVRVGRAQFSVRHLDICLPDAFPSRTLLYIAPSSCRSRLLCVVLFRALDCSAAPQVSCCVASWSPGACFPGMASVSRRVLSRRSVVVFFAFSRFARCSVSLLIVCGRSSSACWRFCAAVPALARFLSLFARHRSLVCVLHLDVCVWLVDSLAPCSGLSQSFHGGF